MCGILDSRAVPDNEKVRICLERRLDEQQALADHLNIFNDDLFFEPPRVVEAPAARVDQPGNDDDPDQEQKKRVFGDDSDREDTDVSNDEAPIAQQRRQGSAKKRRTSTGGKSSGGPKNG